MEGVFGLHCGLWILLFRLLDTSHLVVGVGLMDVHRKECPGTETEMSVQRGDDRNRYEQYRSMYTNCTLVQGNLEIVLIELTDAEYDFSFLQSILEVNGYVLIYGNHVERIRLSGLRVIRGRRLFMSVENGIQRNFSLYVASNAKADDDTVGLKELQLTSLVEILNGDVLFKNNRQLCFGETTVNWSYILDNRKTSANITLPSDPGFEKRTCSESCHENCTTSDSRFCWGRGPDMCQKVRTCFSCGNRCNQQNDCSNCKDVCIGGCNGPNDEHCVACRNFTKDGICVEGCNIAKYNPHTQVMEYPPFTYMHGTLCVRQCPGNMLSQNGTCVTECRRGYKEHDGKNCVPCVGSCPITCRGTDYWLHYGNVDNFKQCTIIKGNLQIKNATLYSGLNDLKLSVDDLEKLRDVEEITGILEVDAWHPNLTSLSFLNNLRVIGGVGADRSNGYSLRIKNTNLRSLDLRSLREIRKGNVGIAGNADLCYVSSINWTRLLAPRGIEATSVTRNSGPQSCSRVCSNLCSADGCWGPGNDNCLSCHNYSFEGRCVSDCISEHGFYSVRREDGALECRRCHKECHMGCTGDGHHECVACKHVQHNETCLSECPSGYYGDQNSTCQPCHSACKECYGEGPFIRKGQIKPVDGCKECESLLLIEDNQSMRCLMNTSECNSTFYTTRESMDGDNKETCRKCHSECDGCSGSEATRCKECRNYRKKASAESVPFECVSNCSDGYYDTGNKVCLPCHPECKRCHGPTEYNCQLCKRVRIYSDRKDVEVSGNDTTNESHCADSCPPDHNSYQNNDTELLCSAVMKSTQPLEPKTAVPVFIFLFLIITIVIVIFATFWRKQKLRRLKESVLANDEIPMISASTAKPDMSLLRLIKESELRRGNMIGSGAFGTVYKGIWIPEKENVKIPVAIKVLQESTNTSQNVELLDEARIMASVCHPYCVRILAVCMTAQMMLVTQLMPLGCLLNYVRKEKSNIGSRAMLLWSVQIAKGMKYLEDLGLVHRDLAARNVLVQSPNQVKITDFGLAKLLNCDQEEIQSEEEKMPIRWLALECVNDRIYTHKSDVWSYGVTLWEMFTNGSKPYENLTARQIPQALEKGERLPQPDTCTIDVYMILIKCWMLDVRSRPTFSDLVNEFTRMAQDPGRFLVIQGDKLMRLPSNGPDAKDLVRLMSLPIDEPDFTVVTGDEYLRPMELDFERDSSSSSSPYPPSSSPLGPLNSIPEDDAYENTRTPGADDLDQKPFYKNGKLHSQYSRQGSQRYIADPCRNEPGQASGEMSRRDAVHKKIHVDEDGYLPPQSTTTAPSYLDVVYFPSNDSTDSSNDKHNLLDNKQYLDMTNTGFAADNPNYFEEDSNYLFAGDYAGSTKLGALGSSEVPNHVRPEYCNVP